MLGKPLVLLSIVVGAKLMWPKDDLGNLVNLYFSTHSLLKFPTHSHPPLYSWLYASDSKLMFGVSISNVFEGPCSK